MMITHYTHICMNCGPVRGGSVDGAPTTVVDGRCERCGSEAVVPMVSHDPYRDPAEEARRQLEALETFHAEIVREKDILIVRLRARMMELERELARELARELRKRSRRPRRGGAREGI